MGTVEAAKSLFYFVLAGICGADAKRVFKKTRFSIADSRLEYYGLCRECREEEAV